MFTNKKIILGVTGSIAAYKAAYLCRLLVKNNAEVKVVMTASACSFVAPLTFSTLSKNDVFVDMFNENNNWNNHVELGLWADVFLIALHDELCSYSKTLMIHVIKILDQQSYDLFCNRAVQLTMQEFLLISRCSFRRIS